MGSPIDYIALQANKQTKRSKNYNNNCKRNDAKVRNTTQTKKHSEIRNGNWFGLIDVSENERMEAASASLYMERSKL